MLHYTGPSFAGGVETALKDFITGALIYVHDVNLIAGRCSAAQSLTGLRTHEVQLVSADHPDILELRDQTPGSVKFKMIEDALVDSLSRIIQPGDEVHAHNIACNSFNRPLVRALRKLVIMLDFRLIAWSWDPVWVLDGGKTLTRELFDLLCRPWPKTLYLTLSAARTSAFIQLGTFPSETVVEYKPYINVARVFSLTDRASRICQTFDLLRADMLIMYPCRASRRKNIELALLVLHELKMEGRSPILLLGGFNSPHRSLESAQYKADLKACSKKLSLSENVIWLDSWRQARENTTGLASEDIMGLHRLSDVLLSTSRDEGFGLGVLEGASNGLPIVASDESTLPFSGHSLITSFNANEATPLQIAKLLTDASSKRRSDRMILSRYWGNAYFKELRDVIDRAFQAA